jgi:hypothetical protein
MFLSGKFILNYAANVVISWSKNSAPKIARTRQHPSLRNVMRRIKGFAITHRRIQPAER